MSTLTQDVLQLLDNANRILGETPAAAPIQEATRRLQQPLRVAIAGKVKAGKSTLLNALVGERLAPTDARECTKIVTWYRDGSTYRVLMHRDAGEPSSLQFRRDENALEISLPNVDLDSIDHLEVEWPSNALRSMTLIDTPGIDSINVDISARTEGFLAPQDQPSSADAVLYLMRHLHESDVRFLESFHDQVASQPGAVNSIGILSRADEIGVGRIDAMGSARRIAARYTVDPKVRKLCQTVIPMSGLLAETATTLRQDEFQQLQTLALADRGALDELLISVDRFNSADTSVAITPIERQELLDRFGLFGVRVSCALIRQKSAASSSELAELLVDRSGLATLRTTLSSHFAARGDVLRARSALLSLERLLISHRPAGVEALDAEIERIVSRTHEFAEVQLLGALRAGHVTLPAADLQRAEVLLGAAGTLAHERLGAEPHTHGAELALLATEQHGYWQALSENPLMRRDSVNAARVLTRSCEGLIAGAAAVR